MLKIKQAPLTIIQKVRALYEQIAGDEVNVCDQIADGFMERGYKPERAWAEALFQRKLVKNRKAER